eukprot:CAMPEP_0196773126 /NCGR_PEP_ID=MMETSP1104-20130614/2599_1 /TAXON_ID=33652 /ORGANISM="Cafeteria sp., Strain Caron Lab Isolate" /LENGTH=579 /DNA_ID=CAMNT_0042143271 /DNA_START=101 /DNA_END=1836 /DNA_ORIENTATION=+
MGGLLCTPDGWGHQRLDVQPILKRLRIKESEARRIFRLFIRADHDRTGEIDIWELLRLVEMEAHKGSALARRVFCAADESGDNSLQFSEFLIAVWNLCTLQQDGLVEFIFFMYDIDLSEGLDADEVEQIITEMLGTSEAKRLVSAFKSRSRARQRAAGVAAKTTFGREDWIAFVRTHPLLMFPAFTLQRELREKVGGKRFWSHLTERRERMGNMAHWRDVHELLHDKTLQRRSTRHGTTTSTSSTKRSLALDSHEGEEAGGAGAGAGAGGDGDGGGDGMSRTELRRLRTRAFAQDMKKTTASIKSSDSERKERKRKQRRNTLGRISASLKRGLSVKPARRKAGRGTRIARASPKRREPRTAAEIAAAEAARIATQNQAVVISTEAKEEEEAEEDGSGFVGRHRAGTGSGMSPSARVSAEQAKRRRRYQAQTAMEEGGPTGSVMPGSVLSPSRRVNSGLGTVQGSVMHHKPRVGSGGGGGSGGSGGGSRMPRGTAQETLAIKVPGPGSRIGPSSGPGSSARGSPSHKSPRSSRRSPRGPGHHKRSPKHGSGGDDGGGSRIRSKKRWAVEGGGEQGSEAGG